MACDNHSPLKHLQLANATRHEDTKKKKNHRNKAETSQEIRNLARLYFISSKRRCLTAGLEVFSFQSRPLYLHLILPIQPFYIFITGVGNAKKNPCYQCHLRPLHQSNRIFAQITSHLYFYKVSTCPAASTLGHFDRNNHF